MDALTAECSVMYKCYPIAVRSGATGCNPLSPVSGRDTHHVWKTLQIVDYSLALKQGFTFMLKGQVGGHLVVSDGTAAPGIHDD